MNVHVVFTFIIVNVIAKAANILPYLLRNFFTRSPPFSWHSHYAIKKKPVRKHVINCGFLVVKCISFFSDFLFLLYLVFLWQINYKIYPEFPVCMIYFHITIILLYYFLYITQSVSMFLFFFL